MGLRTYNLQQAREEVLKAARFRRPQREAFQKAYDIVSGFDDYIKNLSDDTIAERLRESGLQVPTFPPDLQFELATSVGKTRLAGAIMAFLYLAGETRNCLILAPRATVVEKFEREVQASSRKYLLLEPTLVPEPNLCFRSNLADFIPDPNRLNLFVLTPQAITGGDRRFARRSEFRGTSLLDYLRNARDLFVFTDEAHHLPGTSEEEAAAWREAVRALAPRLHFGFTATPVTEAGTNILYKYDLADCLREGLYSKAVHLLVEPKPAAVSDVEWDHVTLDYGLKRLEVKRNALREYAARNPEFSYVEPVMLVVARDTAHADGVASWLREYRGVGDQELLVTHSQKKADEGEIRRLLQIDQPGNRVRVVVNVFQLSEGWDVTNVYVIVPLRAMATFQNAIQNTGRGLRLPAGRRVADAYGGDAEVDILDVLCFGRASLEDILADAMGRFGKGAEGSSVLGVSTAAAAMDESEKELATKRWRIEPNKSVSFRIPKVTRIPPEPNLDFDIGDSRSLFRPVTALDLATLRRSGSDDQGVRYELDDVVRIAADNVLAQLQYLSAAANREAVQKLVRTLLRSLGASESGPIAIDPWKVSRLVGDEIDRRYRSLPADYKLETADTFVTVSAFEWPVVESFKRPATQAELRAWVE